MTEQQKDDEDEEDLGTKEMQTKDLADILSAIDMAAEKLWHIDPDWERSCTVKRVVLSLFQNYFWQQRVDHDRSCHID